MNHTWHIIDSTRTPSNEVVTEVVYECLTTHIVEEQTHIQGHSYRGEVTLTTGSVSDPNFITYENVTEDTILGWVTGSIDTASIQAHNSASVAERVQKFLEANN